MNAKGKSGRLFNDYSSTTLLEIPSWNDCFPRKESREDKKTSHLRCSLLFSSLKELSSQRPKLFTEEGKQLRNLIDTTCIILVIIFQYFTLVAKVLTSVSTVMTSWVMMTLTWSSNVIHHLIRTYRPWLKRLLTRWGDFLMGIGEVRLFWHISALFKSVKDNNFQCELMLS